MKAKLAGVAALITLASVYHSGMASAEPAVPQENTACPASVVGAMTILPNARTPLLCAAQSDGGDLWVTDMSPFAVSDRWLSYGPELKLHGEGLRDGRLKSGEWVATPQDADTACRAEQVQVVGAGVVGPPQISEGAKGKPLPVQVVPQLFSIQMTGYCLWTRVAA
jgi:hypothetical protein